MKLLTSKKAIMVIIGIVILIARQHLKEMQSTPVMELLAPILAYLVGQSMTDYKKVEAQVENNVQSDSVVDTLKELFSQRKAQATFFAIVVAFVHEYAKGLIDDQTLQAMLGLVSTYIVGQGVADIGKSAATVKEKGTEAAGEPVPQS
jgi:predicted histidine transporter YuiF (NhaC family)